jgi:hypothetical protein
MSVPGAAKARAAQAAAAVLVLLCAIVALAPSGPQNAIARDGGDGKPGVPVEVRAAPVNFGPGKTFGRLTYRGGLHLTAEAEEFGGFSGLTLDAYGGLLAVTDQGFWLSARMTYREGRLTGLSGTRMGPVTGRNGRPYRGKFANDAEAIAALPGGRFLIAFEHRHRVGEYSFNGGKLLLNRYLNIPSVLRGMPRNQGLEAVAVFDGGKEIAFFAEKKLDAEGHHSGWVVKGGKVRTLRIARSDEFDITGATVLPGGELMLLERRFVGLLDGVHMRLRLIQREELDSGDLIRGEVLFRGSNFGYAIDNMEGIAAYRNGAGETMIAVISDDNFNRGLQRTLLLTFALDAKAGAALQDASTARP